MTLSPEDKAKMEKVNPYMWAKGTQADFKISLFNEGYTAAAETIAKLKADHAANASVWAVALAKVEAERDKQQKLITAYMDERAGLMDEVDRLREALMFYGDIENWHIDYDGKPNTEYDGGDIAREAITPQGTDYFETPTQGTEPAITPSKSKRTIVGKVVPADTPCEECGTVGGGGRVPGMRSFSASCGDQVWKPCPRCGQLSKPVEPDSKLTVCPNCLDTHWVYDQYGGHIPCDMCRTGSGKPK